MKTSSPVDITKNGLKDFLESIVEERFCPGVTDPALLNFASHSGKQYFVESSAVTQPCVRSQTCAVLKANTALVCTNCRYARHLLLRKKLRATLSERRTIGPKTPLATAAHKKVVEALITQRKKVSQLEKELLQVRNALAKADVSLKADVHRHFHDLLEENLAQADPFVRLFWNEQKAAFQKGSKYTYIL